MAADDDDKTEEPTQKRLDDAREKGEIVYSPEVGAAFSLLVATILAGSFAGPLAGDLGRVLEAILANAGTAATDGGALLKLYAEIGAKIGGLMLLAIGGFALAGVAARFVQDKPVFSAARLKPKFSNLSPMSGFGRMFGPQALGNFGKALLKLTAVGCAVGYVLWPRDGSLSVMSTLDPAALLPLVKERAVSLLIACTIAAGIIAGADYFFARQAFMKRLKMSRQEIKEEYRQSEGDPAVKAKLRQIRTERAQRRMMAAVPKATVVITNPTHYAVALLYNKDEHAAPVCVAKGVNDVALKIRELAAEHDVPLVENPPLARALYATADLEAPIPREHFEAVAKVIGVVMRLAERRRRR